MTDPAPGSRLCAMTRKRVLWLIAIAAFVAAGVALILRLARPEPGMTKANFDRIHRGMTAAEVEALLGATPAWVMEDGPRRLVKYEARDPNRLIRVMNDDDGRVFDKTWEGPVPPTFWKRMKERWFPETVRDG